ncbi:hypothetical protein AXG93_3105s1170 [Marchantia polymorpha subsp. ruderalis]|uniref:Uncharacterized protein n=1 Tax=Marchantia polymorpha subsp. ruderalis TaxID=1480154 RepID=A0A176WJ01_MARPO|nr:hypothetical protein AXG93_3105s1170 [Marchantia polymorpha subsp. ruderalis]
MSSALEGWAARSGARPPAGPLDRWTDGGFHVWISQCAMWPFPARHGTASAGGTEGHGPIAKQGTGEAARATQTERERAPVGLTSWPAGFESAKRTRGRERKRGREGALALASPICEKEGARAEDEGVVGGQFLPCRGLPWAAKSAVFVTAHTVQFDSLGMVYPLKQACLAE